MSISNTEHQHSSTRPQSERRSGSPSRRPKDKTRGGDSDIESSSRRNKEKLRAVDSDLETEVEEVRVICPFIWIYLPLTFPGNT